MPGDIERAHQRLVHLYEVSKLLTHIQTVEETVRAVIGVIDRALGLRTAAVVSRARGHAETIVWGAQGVDTGRVRDAESHALSWYRYLVDGKPLAAVGAESEKSRFIVIPLVIENRPIFGVLLVEGTAGLGEPDLLFVNAVVNQLAIALEWAVTVATRQAAAEAGTVRAEVRQATAEAFLERYEGLIDNLDNAFVWEADARTLQLTYASGAVEGLLGYPISRWLAEPDFLLTRTHPADRDRLEQTLCRTLTEQRNQRCDHRMLTADDRVRWFHTGVHLVTADPATRGLQGVSADITDRKRYENTQRFLAELSVLLVSSVDYAENLERVGRLAVPEFADVCHFEVLDANDPLHRRQPVPFVAEGQVLRVPIVVHGDTLGTLFFAARSDLRDPEAERGLAEEVARRAGVAIDNARLFRKAERESCTREHLLAVVSHDLRNLVGAILTGAELLIRGSSLEQEPRASKNLELIRRSALGMNRLIGDLLDVASIEAGHVKLEPQVLEVGPLVRETLLPLMAQAESKSLRLKSEIADGSLKVAGDRERLFQVFANLIGNALKFTPPGGAVTVRAESLGRDVRFAVTDTGIGMSPEDLPHVFESFWQAETTAKLGTGLGMPIARGIVEAHGGKIWVESQRGVGTTVFFTLPLAP